MPRDSTTCSVCGKPFSEDEWEERHSDEEGEDCHEACCPVCNPPVECGHDSHEDCMLCSVCGHCREDLDSNDVCMDCGGVDEDLLMDVISPENYTPGVEEKST